MPLAVGHIRREVVVARAAHGAGLMGRPELVTVWGGELDTACYLRPEGWIVSRGISATWSPWWWLRRR